MGDDAPSRILALAVAAIDRGGEEAIRVHHIVEEVGVTPPVLYRHFGSREGLVIAAQIERYTRQNKTDIATIGRIVSECRSKQQLRKALVAIWTDSLHRRAENRWRRANVIGSAYARPELASAFAAAQDEVVAAQVEVLEPCRQRGWLRDGIDLPSTTAWQYSLLSGRIYIEQGTKLADAAEWDRLTLDALERAFFGE